MTARTLELDLIKAAEKNDCAAVEDFLKRGADINGVNVLGHTALYTAVLYDQVDTVRLLIDKGADPDMKSHDGRTVLMSAVIMREIEIVKLLADNGARLDIISGEGMTAPDMAAANLFPGIAETFEIVDILDNAARLRLDEKRRQEEEAREQKRKRTEDIENRRHAMVGARQDILKAQAQQLKLRLRL